MKILGWNHVLLIEQVWKKPQDIAHCLISGSRISSFSTLRHIIESEMRKSEDPIWIL
nr:MAG TPA: hypothetical protein [Caudoviricetes sp.]